VKTGILLQAKTQDHSEAEPFPGFGSKDWSNEHRMIIFISSFFHYGNEKAIVTE
jgi:hypothetical protein